MKPFTTLTSRVIPLLINNIDTDQIIPARYLKVTDKEGLVEGLFHNWRYSNGGDLIPNFVLNQPFYQDSSILLVGDNFGCGSSREHAPWALLGWGIRAIISTSFADIFRNNALKNGLLPVIVDHENHEKIIDLITSDSKSEMSIDLSQQTIHFPDGTAIRFPIDPFARQCLLDGLDQLGYIRSFDSLITAFEKDRTTII